MTELLGVVGVALVLVVGISARSCLDELDRRHPRAVAMWLGGAPGADSDPTPYLRRGFDDVHQEER